VELRLRPLADDELAAYIEASRAGYRSDLVDHARFPPAFAVEKADRDLAAYTGVDSVPEGHSIYWLEDGDERVGRLWFAERPSPRLGRVVWLYEIEIDPAFRGRGYGRRAMALLEEEVRARGIGEIALNVWGGNDVARSLYRSEGYFERAVEMAKELA
jgi:ribosomal protein S18 acetylase RimI-like enzyme